ncbi:MAG TPA: hypothetical protein VMS60_06585 [Solirubrobacterales bacterium]|nr:hypothetical protein [Solirubrobacterales bacterium]
MYDFAQPGDPPACSFQFNKGGIRGITVDPFAGTPFFFSYKLPKRLYQLGPCNPATGKFEGSGGAAIIGETEVKPERDDLYGLAYDPLRQFSSGRPAGVLYGAAPAAVPNEGTGEPGQSSLGYIFAPAEETPPEILEQSVLLVRATSAQLRAVIDPNNFKTRYSFQYLTEAAYQEAGESLEGAPEAPAGEAFLSGTGAPEAVGATLSGLEADTAYRFRAVARSHCSAGEPGKICEVSGDVKSLRTYPAGIAGLPDGRAYELVSPANKNGEQVLPAEPQISSCGPIECKPGDTYEHYPMLSAPDGDAVAYEGTNFGGGVGAPIENAYIARRSESGWLTVNPTPSLLQKAAPGYLAYDQALAKAILGQPRPVLGSAPPEYKNLYAQSTLSPFAVTPLVASEPPSRPPTGSGEFKLNYAGASADLSRVYFEANDALTGATPVAPAALDGGPSKSNLYEWERATGQLRLVNVLPGNTEAKAGSSFGVASANSISADGSRAFWSSEAGQVFVREGAAETVAIPGSGPAAKFLSAATDGSKVLLANGSLYDLEAEASVDLSEGKGGFEGIAGQSDDLSHVYFVDTEVLTGEQENSEGAVAQAGKFNLYAWEGVGTTSYVATLAAQDNGDGLFPSNDWSPFPFARTAQASQAGRYLAFLSRAPLTGYDNEGPCTTTGNPPKLVDFPCPEVFLYDSESGALECASCNPSGASSLGGSVLRRIKAPAVVPSSLPQPRYLLDSGRLYFDSQESLSQLDTNEGVEDVYQYEAEGTGSCGREGGCVALISSGRDGVDSNFLAIDQSAKNVFFTTRERLLPADQDELIDLYDAREGGGFAENAPSTPGELPLQVPPVEPTPASPTLNDPGNVPPPKGCKKGQVKKKGKCVKKHKPKKKSGNKAKRGGGK